MITLQTITTIELSSFCNLECKYCINRLIKDEPTRLQGLMSEEVFKKTCELLQKLCDQGTQREVNLNGNGESLLDYRLLERIPVIREIVGDRHIGLSTNGVLVTKKMAIDLFKSGITQVDISPHSPYHARKAAHNMYNAGMRKGIVSMGCIVMSHNWAGQLEQEHQINCMLSNYCEPLIEGRGYVLNEGNITVCCYDYRNLGVYGTVFDEDILDHPIKPYELCHTCHQIIPPFICKENDFVQFENQEVCIA